MEIGELRKMLAHAKHDPVNCALVLNEDGKSLALSMDRVKQPRALLQSLEKEHPKASMPRFGTVEIDEVTDEKLARFRLNRSGSGLARRLARALKGTGINKVELVQEDGSVEAAGEEEEGASAPAAESTTAAAASSAHDPAQLSHALAVLAGRIAAVAPDTRVSLVALATTAQLALKAGDVTAAGAAIQSLNAALVKATAGKPQGASPRATWLAAKEQVDAKLGALAQELRSYEDPDLNQIAEFGLFGLSQGRETVALTAALLDYDGAAPAGREASKKRLLTAVVGYRAMIEGSAVAKMVDDNPFGVEVGLQKVLGAALQQIEHALG